MQAYLVPLRYGLWAFPLIAFLITTPYAVAQYHKYGSLHPLKAITFYLFVYYLLNAYFLVILPLPSIDSVRQAGFAGHLSLEPFDALQEYIQTNPAVFTSKRALLKMLTSPVVFQIAANMLMFMPFGFFMRYYYKRSWWQTLLLSFFLSLFFELTQLSGLYGIYPYPYRTFEVTDLITNTTGGLLGFLIAPVLTYFLPSREELDARSRHKSVRVSLVRRMFANVVDWGLVIIVVLIIMYATGSGWSFDGRHLTTVIAALMLYQTVSVCVTGGTTLGKRLCNIRVVAFDGGRASTMRLIVRNLMLYGMFFCTFVLAPYLYAGADDWVQPVSALAWIAAVLMDCLFALFMFESVVKLFGGNRLYLYARLSRTQSVSTFMLEEESPYHELTSHPTHRRPRGSASGAHSK